MARRLLYVIDHPIQYQAPLLRLIAAEDGIELSVAFGAAAGAEPYFDGGFGRSLAWDVALLEGYEHEVVAGHRRLSALIAESDAVWMHGWQGPRMWRALQAARRHGVPVLMRGENTLSAMPDGNGIRGALKRRYLDWIFTRSAAFLCIGAANRDYYVAHGVSARRLFSMPYAVDNGFFQARVREAAGRRDAFRADLGLADDRPVVLFAGVWIYTGLLGKLGLVVAFALWRVYRRRKARRPGDEARPYPQRAPLVPAQLTR